MREWLIRRKLRREYKRLLEAMPPSERDGDVWIEGLDYSVAYLACHPRVHRVYKNPDGSWPPRPLTDDPVAWIE